MSHFMEKVSSVSSSDIMGTVAIVDSDEPGIKSRLFEYCTESKLLTEIQRIETGKTQAIIQGHQTSLQPHVLEALRDYMLKEFGASMTWGDLISVPKKDRLTVSSIQETSPLIKRHDSSGNLCEKVVDPDDIPLGGSAEDFKSKFFDNVDGVVAQKWISETKHVYVQYRKQMHILEISSIHSMGSLMDAVDKRIKVPQPAQMLYTVRNCYPVPVTHIRDLVPDCLYYVLLANEQLPENKSFNVHFQDQLHTITFLSHQNMDQVFDIIEKTLSLSNHIQSLYYSNESFEVQVEDEVENIVPGRNYYVLTIQEKLPKRVGFHDMQGFFDILKLNHGMHDQDINHIKTCFEKESINASVLKASGEYKLTKEDLKEAGINQVGLRRIILQVIGSNK